jgi:serpin B
MPAMLADSALPGSFTSRLGFALYRELLGTQGNLFFSPLGIANALVMAQAGAGGSTHREIEEVLHCEGAGDTLVAQISALNRELRGQGSEHEATRLSLANALWVQTGYPIHPAYVASLSEGLNAEARNVDFDGRPSEVVRTINSWIAERTANRIRSILSEGQLTSLTRSILTNAIYLKAPWEQTFEEQLTRPLPFHLSDGTRIEVPTMFQTVHHDYAEDGGLQFLQIRYQDSRVSMLILLPERGQLERVERELDTARLTRLVQAMEPRDVWLFLPRFRVESLLLLLSALKSLGMRTAFGPDADFTRVSSEPGFQVGQIVHKTFVNVDESGTEAAGATSSTFIGAVYERVEVRVDRPFLFLIRDANTGTVLFMGRVVDPRPS